MSIFIFLDKAIALFVPHRYHKLSRYLISGGTAAATDLVLLYLFTTLLDIWYLLSAIMAFIIAFVVSFVLQKFWTFTDRSTHRWKSQALVYLVITSTNLGLNTLMMYIFVSVWGFHYMPSQVVISGLIAIESYFVYQIFVFKKRPTEVDPGPLSI